MDRLKVILCRIEILFTCEKEGNFGICCHTVDLENMLSEASQVWIDKEYMIPLTKVIWSRQIHEIRK